VQQFCEQPPSAVMPVMGQSGAILAIAIGQPGAQAGANPAAQFRLERTGCAVRRATTRTTEVFSRSFICSPTTLETRVHRICVQNHTTFVNLMQYSCHNSEFTFPPSAPRSAPACLLCASPD
jgi:hypothetical protein